MLIWTDEWMDEAFVRLVASELREGAEEIKKTPWEGLYL